MGKSLTCTSFNQLSDRLFELHKAVNVFSLNTTKVTSSKPNNSPHSMTKFSVSILFYNCDRPVNNATPP